VLRDWPSSADTLPDRFPHYEENNLYYYIFSKKSRVKTKTKILFFELVEKLKFWFAKLLDSGYALARRIIIYIYKIPLFRKGD
jgi:hypothetical protein